MTCDVLFNEFQQNQFKMLLSSHHKTLYSNCLTFTYMQTLRKLCRCSSLIMKMNNESLQNQNKKAANLSSENLAKLM